MNQEQGAPESVPQYKVPIVLAEDDFGNKGAYVPVMDPLTLMSAMAQQLNQSVAQLTLLPGLTPEPDEESINAAKMRIQALVDQGLINPRAIDMIDPSFQVKMETNLIEVLKALFDMAALAVAQDYDYRKNPDKYKKPQAEQKSNIIVAPPYIDPSKLKQQ